MIVPCAHLSLHPLQKKEVGPRSYPRYDRQVHQRQETTTEAEAEAEKGVMIGTATRAHQRSPNAGGGRAGEEVQHN